jgi:hypothetical protein
MNIKKKTKPFLVGLALFPLISCVPETSAKTHQKPLPAPAEKLGQTKSVQKNVNESDQNATQPGLAPKNVDWVLKGLPSPLNGTGNAKIIIESPTELPDEWSHTLIQNLNGDCEAWASGNVANWQSTKQPIELSSLSDGLYSLCVWSGRPVGKVVRYTFAVDKSAPDLSVSGMPPV